jgi:hypothetical protein
MKRGEEMEKYIYKKNKYEENEHILLKTTENFGLSIVKYRDSEGMLYNIVPIVYKINEDYEIIGDKTLITRNEVQIEKCIECFNWVY